MKPLFLHCKSVLTIRSFLSTWSVILSQQKCFSYFETINQYMFDLLTELKKNVLNDRSANSNSNSHHNGEYLSSPPCLEEGGIAMHQQHRSIPFEKKEHKKIGERRMIHFCSSQSARVSFLYGPLNINTVHQCKKYIRRTEEEKFERITTYF